MDDQQKRSAGEWLDYRAPGFGELPDLDRHTILDFVFLWSLFEAKVMRTYAKARKIGAKVDEWEAKGTLNASCYEDELSYFRRRYFADGGLTHRFYRLDLRPSDFPETVTEVIVANSESPRDKVLALLMIVWRLRNNLFHGVKWSDGLLDQRENFTNANSVLMKVLDQHGQF